MGKYDRKDAEYFAEPHRQAELITNGVFHGKVKVHAEGLVSLSGKYPSLRTVNGVQERDIICFYPPHEVKYGTEIENYPDYGMPRRFLPYDACEYEKEAREIHARHMERKDYANFIEKKSGIKQDEYYTAIVNSVLYLGQGHYKGRRTLRECFKIPEEIREHVWDKIQNYSFNLIEADYVNPEDYETELRQFFEAMQARGDREKLERLMEQEDFKNLSLDTQIVITVHLNHEKLLKIAEEEGEEYDMCKAIRDMMNDSRNEGREEGKIEGKIEGSIIMCKKLGVSSETAIKNIKEEYHLSDSEIEKNIALYW